ncbi:MAG: hypothetical protein IIA50_05805 [Bacteroidetes bacterium]|nr:hypothetical protein [Bacteroidota bacterium]
MTDKLEEAVAQAMRLPVEQQDAIAALILEEIEDEARWDSTFSSSPDVLERLASEADEEDRQGLTQNLDTDTL